MPVVNPNAVAFSAKTRLYLGPYGTPEASLSAVGLLGRDATLNIEQTFRQKLDMFPEVPVASAIQAQSGTLEAVLREWRRDNIAAAIGLYPTDASTLPGSDVSVTDEEYTFSSNGIIILRKPAKIGSAITVKGSSGTATYAEGTDYLVIRRDPEGRTLIVRNPSGTIPEGAGVKASYTYTQAATNVFPIGQVAEVRYYTAKLVEELTNGGRTEVFIPKARIGLRGGIRFNAVEEGADLPIVIQALYDPAHGKLLDIREVQP